MPSLDVEYIASIAGCWRNQPAKLEELRERGREWPVPLTWAWYLGERVTQYDAAHQLEILSVAFAHVAHARVRLTAPPGELWQAAKDADDAVRLRIMAAVGRELDAHNERVELEELERKAAIEAQLEAQRQAAELLELEADERARADKAAELERMSELARSQREQEERARELAANQAESAAAELADVDPESAQGQALNR